MGLPVPVSCLNYSNMPTHIPSPFPESYSRISSPIPVTTAVKNMYKSIVNFQDRSQLLNLLETKYPELSSTIDLFFINELQIAHLNDVQTRLVQNLIKRGIATPLYEVVNQSVTPAPVYLTPPTLTTKSKAQIFTTSEDKPTIKHTSQRPPCQSSQASQSDWRPLSYIPKQITIDLTSPSPEVPSRVPSK